MNKAMMMDFYEMTMANSYFKNKANKDKRVVFDVFYRKNPDKGGFSIFAGLEQIIDYILTLHFDDEDINYFRSLNMFDEEFLRYLSNFKFKGDLYAFPEGTIIYPNEPIITIVAPLIDAQIIETEILLQINHQSLIATKANRIVRAAGNHTVSDFGARRAHNNDSAIYGARAAYIGGVNSTATVAAGQKFNIPLNGTMAHSYIMYYQDEYEAFKHYAQTYPDEACFLVDTYDVLKSGIPNVIRIEKEILAPIGKRVKSIRLDSGDLAYLSKQARLLLDDNGMYNCKIVASNSLDEYTIKSLLEQDAKIDIFGVGERMITAKSEPVFGAVYKIAAVEDDKNNFDPRIKISENIDKITNPGLKDVYRVYKDGLAIGDLLATHGEHINKHKQKYKVPDFQWNDYYYENCEYKKLQKQYISQGQLIQTLPSLKEIRQFVQTQLKRDININQQRFDNPQTYPLVFTYELNAMKMNLLSNKGKA